MINKSYLKECPYCGSHNIGIGYHLGNGQLFSDHFAYHFQNRASKIETYFCKDCGMVIAQKVLHPEIFDNAEGVREEELLDIIERYGYLLVNKHDHLPSLDEMGFGMQNVIGLIKRHQVFYTKVFKKRPIFLGIKTYQLLKRIRAPKTLDDVSKMILKEIEKYDVIDKEELKKKLKLETKVFNKAFDRLLEEMLITAVDGKKLNANWYSYLYTSAKTFNKSIEGLHFSGDEQAELWKLLSPTMDQKDFSALIG